MYWGGYFITDQRLRTADFTTPFLDTGLLLVTQKKVVARSSLLDLPSLSPFTPRLWLVIVFLAVYAGVVFWFLENRSPNQRGVAKQKFVSEINMKPPYGLSWVGFKRNFSESQYLSFTGITGMSVHTPVTFYGQIFSIVFNLACVIIVASYTANLTSFLTREAGATAFTNVEQMVSGTCLFVNCTPFRTHA
jgi:hypothetical protein